MTPNHFSLLNFPISFDLDAEALRRAYVEKQRERHPDKAARGDDQARLAAIQLSADLNRAYRTLKEPLTRAEYLLGLHGVRVGGEEDSVKPSQELLMESMDMRERLLEAETADDIAALRGEADALREEMLGALAERLRAGDYAAAAQPAIRLRYLEKLQGEIRARAGA